MGRAKPVQAGMFTIRGAINYAKERGVKWPYTTVKTWCQRGQLPVSRDEAHHLKRFLISERALNAKLLEERRAKSLRGEMLARSTLMASLGPGPHDVKHRIKLALRETGEQPIRLSDRHVLVPRRAESIVRETQKALESTISTAALGPLIGLAGDSVILRIRNGFLPAKKVMKYWRTSRLLYDVLGKIWASQEIKSIAGRRRFFERAIEALSAAERDYRKRIIDAGKIGDKHSESVLLLECIELMQERKRLKSIRRRLTPYKQKKRRAKQK